MFFTSFIAKEETLKSNCNDELKKTEDGIRILQLRLFFAKLDRQILFKKNKIMA